MLATIKPYYPAQIQTSSAIATIKSCYQPAQPPNMVSNLHNNFEAPQCNYIQAHKPTAYNSQQPTANLQHTFRSQQPPSTFYEQSHVKPCKASCVLLAAGQLAQCAFGVNSHPNSVNDPMAPPVRQSTIPHIRQTHIKHCPTKPQQVQCLNVLQDHQDIIKLRHST